MKRDLIICIIATILVAFLVVRCGLKDSDNKMPTVMPSTTLKVLATPTPKSVSVKSESPSPAINNSSRVEPTRPSTTLKRGFVDVN